MIIFKKILGAVIIIFTILFTFPVIYAIRITTAKSISKFEIGEVGAFGYAIGSIICLVFYLALTYFLIKKSLKLIRRKRINAKTIDEIGQEE